MGIKLHKREGLICFSLISILVSHNTMASESSLPILTNSSVQSSYASGHFADGGTEVKLAQIEDKNQKPEPAAAQEDFYPLEIPVVLNDLLKGDITAEVTLSGYARVPAARLMELLNDFLTDPQKSLLQGYGEELVLLETLRDRGLIAVYDPSELTIKVNLPRLGVEKINVSGRTIDDINVESFEEPAKVSAGIGLIARPSYVHKSVSGDTGFAPFAADMRGFVSFGGFKNWSLAYEGDFLEGRDSEFRRGDVTLTRDDFKRALRYQFGDITPSISGFQSNINLLGVGIERNYGAIQPFRNLRPGGRTTFNLEREARVSYEVNGAIIGTDILEAGDYDIRSLPLTTGANDVRIIVDDEFGEREVGSYSTFVDTELLADSALLFGLNAGAIRKQISQGFGYDYTNDLAVTGFIEKGMSRTLTLGTQFEATQEGGFWGGRAVKGFGSNVIALETGVSKFSGDDVGYTAALRYSRRPTRRGRSAYNQFDVQAGYQNEDFRTLGNVSGPVGELYQISARNSYTRGRTSYNLNGSWQKTDAEETTVLGASIRLPIQNVSTTLGYQGRYTKSRDEFDNRLFITISRNFGEYGTVRTRGATNPDELELEWRRLSTLGVGAVAGRASYLLSEEEDELSAEASYILPRAEVGINHRTALAPGFGRTLTSRTDARIGVGLGFADGALALGRPVSDGFFILKGHSALQGKSIETFQGGVRKSGKTDILGATLVPLSGSYREQTHNVSIEELPTGYDIGSGQIRVFPSQNTGYKIRIGSDPAALVMGNLKTVDGEPIALSLGRIVPKDSPDSEGYPLFTNRTGRFVAEQVPPGTYLLILMPGDRVIKELEIGEGIEGVVNVGAIQVEAE